MQFSISINKGIEIIKSVVKNLPEAAGIYKMINDKGEVVYVGKAKNLPKRVISYAKVENLPTRLKRMVSTLSKIEYLTTLNEAQALLLEANLIKSLKPKFNIALKDDKSFPYIVIEDDHEYPRITKFRGTQTKGRSYFGPFAQARNVNNTIVELQKIFLLRPCTNSFFESRRRPCLQYQIKRCSGPCVKKISSSAYKELVKEAKDFLNGKNSNIQAELNNQMELASKNLEYEKAAILRDRIRILSQMQAKNIFKTDSYSDLDVISLHNGEEGAAIQLILIRNGRNYGDRVYFPQQIEGLANQEIIELFIGQLYQKNPPASYILVCEKLENKSSLEEALSMNFPYKIKIIDEPKGSLIDILEFAKNNAKEALNRELKNKAKNQDTLEAVAKLFDLPNTPKRIEVYDNSHTFGEEAIGGMVVAGSEGLIKSQYRKFNIKSTDAPDDYAMLREVLTRRLKRLTDENYPDLMLIDGGAGHLSVAHEVLHEAGVDNIKLVCIAKGPERNAGREFFHMYGKEPFQLDKTDPTLHYLQFLRNEVHRFAITSHRGKRDKKIIRSSIDDIPNIGKLRKKLLLAHFGSYEHLCNASLEDIIRIKGFNKISAQNIYSYLHKDRKD